MISIHDELHFAPADLWLDARRSRATSFISHAHSDHVGLHELSVCTPQTAALTRLRLNIERASAAVRFHEFDYGQSFSIGGIPMRLAPAGHILGSAQLVAETSAGTLVYTGDFKLRAGRTHAPCEVPRCDVLVMECTFGRPHYRFPDRGEIERRLVDLCRDALERGTVPVVYAYSLGKAQEVMHVLSCAGMAVMAHGAVAAISDAFTAMGVDVGPYERYDRHRLAGHVLVTPPETRRMPMIEQIVRRVDIAVTGWAMDGSTRFRMGVDEALPYSDHADFPELLAYVERARPSKVYCLHGFKDFVHHLRARGVNAEWLAPNAQLELFR